MEVGRGSTRGLMVAVAIGCGLVGWRCSRAPGMSGSPDSTSDSLALRTLSTRADRVSGGNVLVEVTLPDGGDGAPLTVTLNGLDVSDVFDQAGSRNVRVGLVGGLIVGPNTLEVDGAPWRVPSASLALTNYPVTGPIVSGPHLEPFVCQTDEFILPDGSTLGEPLDDDCTAETVVQYVYMPAGESEVKPMSSTLSLPADVAMTTTVNGTTRPFVVRVETGTMNRGVYQNVVLHDPTTESSPSPLAPPAGWNRRLIALHGSGCPGGWYRQGGALGVRLFDATNIARLGEGYAIFANTLNHPSNSCNPFLAGETTMMGKEHFIETFGVPDFTISMGGSGGAYTSLQVGDAFPGLFDGVLVTATFPDALSIALAGLDAHLLMHYFTVGNPGELTEAQQVAIGGYHGLQAMIDAANQAQRTDPVPGRLDLEGYASAQWHDAVPEALRYHPTQNPAGARPTVFDAVRNIYGTNPETGSALRPFDNIGVQYGLEALNGGMISLGEFFDLNERVGGYDEDANYVTTRSVGSTDAIERLYQSGVTLGGGGGLASIPVFDAGRYGEDRGYHYQWFHFAVRERMRKENGLAENHLMWRGAVPPEEAWDVMVGWLTAIHADAMPGSPSDRMMRNRPARAIDGCWVAESEGAAARFVAEPQTFSRDPDSTCNAEFPSYAFARYEAGGPIDGNVLKCQLKAIDPSDYDVALNAAAVERLKRVFPDGVCDWSKPGVKQASVVPWASFGPAPESLLFMRKD